MIRYYLPNTNKSAIVAKTQKFSRTKQDIKIDVHVKYRKLRSFLLELI